MIRIRPFHNRGRLFSFRSSIVIAAEGLFFLLAVMLSAAPAGAESTASLTAQGNKAYAAGDYKKALGLYDQAAKKEQLPIISYDRGNALYRLGNFEEARKAYDKAAGDLKNADLATRAYYNMGNAAYREGEARQKQEPDKAMTLFSESAASYREALRRDPTLAGAGANLELANRKIKELATLKKQQQAAQQGISAGQNKGQEKEQASKSLNDLAERQKQLAEQTEKRQNDRQGNEVEQQKADDTLAAHQKELRQQTEKKAQNGKNAANPQTQKDLQDAEALQKEAEEKLLQDQLPQAAELQKKAAEKLTQAAAEEQKKKGGKTAQPQQQRKKAGEQAQRQAMAANKKGAGGQTADREQSRLDSATAPQLDPRQILNQEKIQRQLRRQRMTASGSLRVGKDW